MVSACRDDRQLAVRPPRVNSWCSKLLEDLMAKFRCVCGETIRISGDIPNPIEWHLLSDVDSDAFQGLVQAQDVYMATTPHVSLSSETMHLSIFWRGYDHPPALYSPQAGPAIVAISTASAPKLVGPFRGGMTRVLTAVGVARAQADRLRSVPGE